MPETKVLNSNPPKIHNNAHHSSQDAPRYRHTSAIINSTYLYYIKKLLEQRSKIDNYFPITYKQCIPNIYYQGNKTKMSV